jgi:hypothetical protein
VVDNHQVRALAVIAGLGLVAALLYPVLNTRRAVRQEAAAVALLHEVEAAQALFHEATGGYAASLDSLAAGCDGAAPFLAAPLVGGHIVDAGHEVAMRAARAAVPGPPDCHGRPTASDYYVSARPQVMGRDGSRGMAMTSAGRIFLFFDGVPPTEADMAPGGLAMPLDAMERIP